MNSEIGNIVLCLAQKQGTASPNHILKKETSVKMIDNEVKKLVTSAYIKGSWNY
jgi:hypothetical protein